MRVVAAEELDRVDERLMLSVEVGGSGMRL